MENLKNTQTSQGFSDLFMQEQGSQGKQESPSHPQEKKVSVQKESFLKTLHEEKDLNLEGIRHKGLVLKKSREAQGYSLESVHEATKIPLDVLRAIEEGYTIRTLSSFYYRGFLKIYAKYLNVDAEKIFDEAPQEHAYQRIKKQEKEPVDVFEEWTARFLTPQRKKQMFYGIGILLTLILAVQSFSFIAGKIQSQRKKHVMIDKPLKVSSQEGKKDGSSSVISVSPPKKEKEFPKIDSIAKSPAIAVKPKIALDSAQEIGNIALAVRARKNSWLRVKVDGKIVFQATLNQGSAETWDAKETIEISGKNLNQLEFELNGKMIGVLGREDRKAKTVMITKEGLNVTK